MLQARTCGSNHGPLRPGTGNGSGLASGARSPDNPPRTAESASEESHDHERRCHPSGVRQRRRRRGGRRGRLRNASAGRPAETALRHCRHRRARGRDVGPPDCAAVQRRRRVRRAVRYQPAARRSREETDGRLLPDLHELRRDAGESQAGPADGHDRRRLPQRIHRARPRARARRHDRKADDDRREAVPGRAGRRTEERPQHRRDLQLPLCAEASEDQGTADVC